MTDEQMRSDLAVLEFQAAYWLENDEEIGEPFQRIHDYLSARLADAVQPAAGEGGPAVEFARWVITNSWFEANRLADASLNKARALGLLVDDEEGTPQFSAALSTSVPAGVVVPREPTEKMLEAAIAPPAQEPTR